MEVPKIESFEHNFLEAEVFRRFPSLHCSSSILYNYIIRVNREYIFVKLQEINF